MARRSPKHFFSKLASVSMPRSSFDMSYTDTVTFGTDYLYPNYKQLVLPGDTVNLSYNNFVRMLAPITTPMMDNLYMDVHWWFVPFRLVWDYSKNFFGEQRRPSDPTDFSIPQITFNAETQLPENYVAESTPFAGLPQSRSIYDYFDIPIQGTDNNLTGDLSLNALPLRMYNLIFDEWYRDEQRVDYSYSNFGNDSDTADKYTLLKRGKRFDYYTSSLLQPQIGNPVDIPLGTTAPVAGNGLALGLSIGTQNYGLSAAGGGTSQLAAYTGNYGKPYNTIHSGTYNPAGYSLGVTTDPENSGLYADLSQASSATIATLRQAFQLQAYNEINARNGSRYTEYLYGQFGVISPDARLQRPEFLGGTHQLLQVQPIVQNSSTDSTSPQGNLSGIIMSGTNEHVFTRSFTEHGYIIGIANIYSDLTYYQGLDRDWSISTPLDIPIPVFGNLTDEAIYRKELVLTGTDADDEVFGYGERYSWAKYQRNRLRGLVRPNAPLTVGQWSLAQQLTSNIGNNSDFIESNTPVSRISAVDGQTNFIVNQEFKVDMIRVLPRYADPEKWMFRT